MDWLTKALAQSPAMMMKNKPGAADQQPPQGMGLIDMLGSGGMLGMMGGQPQQQQDEPQHDPMGMAGLADMLNGMFQRK